MARKQENNTASTEALSMEAKQADVLPQAVTIYEPVDALAELTAALAPATVIHSAELRSVDAIHVPGAPVMHVEPTVFGVADEVVDYVNVYSPSFFNLRPDHYTLVPFAKGANRVERKFLSHPYVISHGVIEIV